MQASDLYLVSIILAMLITLSPILGSYLFYVFNRPSTRTEQAFYRFTRVSVSPMNWKQYAWALLSLHAVSLVGMMFLFYFNARAPISWDLAFNISISFITNTDWQAYTGENTLSYATQMLALTVQNFLSAAVGMAVLLAFMRGLTGNETQNLGNFWTDVFRGVVYILIPISLIIAVVLVSQGAIQNFSPNIQAIGVEGFKQLLPMGPAASQTAIAVLGGNGGGFFGQNIAHPFANPNEISNFILSLSILILPAAWVHYYGLHIGAKKQAWVILTVMFALFLLFFSGTLLSEFYFGSLEGQEVRFGQVISIFLNTSATATSNGSVNTMMESLSPLASGFMMLQMMLGEVIFGGIGSGLYGILLFVLLTVFISGLMIGRTPEYLGKKIEAQEMNWILVAILIPGIFALMGTGITCLLKPQSGTFSELLYAFTSTANNNGSAFAALNANTLFFNLILSAVMLMGRFGTILPVLLIAGIIGKKRPVAIELRTFETDTPLFGILLGSVILLVGALTFLPAWFLGPLLEQVTLIGALK